jgi:hypothetical protein
VHPEEPGAFTELGVHISADTVAGGEATDTCTTPPVAVSGIAVPSAAEAITPVTWIGLLVLVDVVETVTLATATTPSPIPVVFIPNTRHMIWPLVGLHEMLLPAPDATAPIATDTALKSVAL